MKLEALLEHGANVIISMTPADLNEFALQVIENWRSKFQPKQEETYYSADEAARLLGCSKPTLWRWQKAGYLVPVKVGMRVRYKHSDIARILGEKGGVL